MVGSITLTEKAASKIKEMMEREGKKDSALRVYIAGGGCSGFQYGMGFDDQKEGDQVYQQHGLKILLDPKSLLYLNGATVDYEESLTGMGFKINNPNATRTCGCGQSFSCE